MQQLGVDALIVVVYIVRRAAHFWKRVMLCHIEKRIQEIAVYAIIYIAPKAVFQGRFTENLKNCWPDKVNIQIVNTLLMFDGSIKTDSGKIDWR